MSLLKGPQINSAMSQINLIPHIDTYFFNIHSNIGSHIFLGSPRGLVFIGLPINILKALLPFHILAMFFAHLNLLDLITLNVNGTN